MCASSGRWCSQTTCTTSRLRGTSYGVVQINNVMKSARPEGKGPGYQWIAYDEPQVVVRFHDGYTGRLLYAEGISAAEAKAEAGKP